MQQPREPAVGALDLRPGRPRRYAEHRPRIEFAGEGLEPCREQLRSGDAAIAESRAQGEFRARIEPSATEGR